MSDIKYQSYFPQGKFIATKSNLKINDKLCIRIHCSQVVPIFFFFAMLPIMNKSCKMSAANYGSVFSNKKHSDIIYKHVSVSYALCLINVTLIDIYTILQFA